MESKYIDLVINRLTQAQYDELKRNNQISEEELYEIIDHDDLFYYKTQLYTKEEINRLLSELPKVIPNPELVGGETILDSVQINGINFRVYPEGSIEFNTQKSSDPDAYTLRSITVGSDIWNLPEGGSGGSGGASSEELLELSNQVGNLATEVQLKANTSDVYNKTEIDAMLSEGVGGTTVIGNVELDGGEEVLESIQIEDTKYSLQGQDMTFSENISDDPEAKVLKTITIGTDDWKVDKGSVVTPNVELTGDEPVLESVQIDDSTFTLKGEEMTFSESQDSKGTVLKTIYLGNDIWSIPSGSYATEDYVDRRIEELVETTPEILETIRELSSSLEENQDVMDTLTASIANKLDKSMIVYSETQPVEGLVPGLIWLKPVK